MDSLFFAFYSESQIKGYDSGNRTKEKGKTQFYKGGISCRPVYLFYRVGYWYQSYADRL